MIELICIKNRSKRYHRKFGWYTGLGISINDRFRVWEERDISGETEFYIKVGSWCLEVTKVDGYWILKDYYNVDLRFVTLDVFRDSKLEMLI